jgi:hypothetical protein
VERIQTCTWEPVAQPPRPTNHMVSCHAVISVWIHAKPALCAAGTHASPASQTPASQIELPHRSNADVRCSGASQQLLPPSPPSAAPRTDQPAISLAAVCPLPARQHYLQSRVRPLAARRKATSGPSASLLDIHPPVRTSLTPIAQPPRQPPAPI